MSEIRENDNKVPDEDLDEVPGGTGPNDFDMEYWQRYMQESQETAQEGLTVDPHSKKIRGRLFR